MNKILFIGSNPSVSSPDNSPFHPQCATRKTIEKWLHGLHADCMYINVVDYKTLNNKPLKMSEIKVALPSLITKIYASGDRKIIAVGSAAKKAMFLTQKAKNIDYICIPHPSGRTRIYNDKNIKNQIIQTVRDFIEGKI